MSREIVARGQTGDVQAAALRAMAVGEWSYLYGYFFTHAGVTPRRVGLATWCAELGFEIAHKLRYPRFKYLYKLDLSSLGVKDADRVHGVQYETANSYALAQCFHALGRFLPAFGSAVFVDVGCGAGRVLHEASRRGFRRLVGIEISDVMCGLCERNLAAYLAREISWTIVNENIRHLSFDAGLLGTGGSVIFFLNNPFKQEIAEVFAAKLDALADRDVYVVYIWKQYPEPLLERGFRIVHEQKRRDRFTLDSFRVYHRASAGR